jgi:hypothetical protein
MLQTGLYIGLVAQIMILNVAMLRLLLFIHTDDTDVILFNLIKTQDSNEIEHFGYIDSRTVLHVILFSAAA